MIEHVTALLHVLMQGIDPGKLWTSFNLYKQAKKQFLHN
jgi:hypothetical protein